jgi:LPS export ABC transporter protein LptC
MRNSEAQRYARWSAGMAGLLVVLVIGVYLQRLYQAKQIEKKAPPPVPPTVEQRSAEFSFSKVEGQRTIFTVRSSQATQFKGSSRNLLEDVSIIVYGKKGERHDTVRTRSCDFISSTGKISCAGDVLIDLRDAKAPAESQVIHVATSSVSFDRDSGEVQTDQPVTFQWPEGAGRAVGAHYSSTSGMLSLESEVELTMGSPSPAKPGRFTAPEANPLRLESSRMIFRRDTRTVELLGAVHAQQGVHELVAENLLLELDAELYARRLLASGHPQLREAGAHGPIVLEASEISSLLTPGGWVESAAATGGVHGSRATPEGSEELRAGRTQVTFFPARNQPRVLTVDGGVTLDSQAAGGGQSSRHLETDALEAQFAAGPRSEPARLESVRSLAPARAEWHGLTTVSGKSAEEAMRINGQAMDLSFTGQNQVRQLVATGGAEVVRQLGDGPQQTTQSRELTTTFSSGGEWSVIDQTGEVLFREAQRTAQAEHARLDRAANTVILTGSVVLADAASRTTAQSATFSQNSNELHADGNVLTTELRAGTGTVANFASEAAHISAEHLVADSARGHAVYSGHGRLWQGGSVIEAETIELDNPSRTLLARGQVHAVFPQAIWTPRPWQSVRAGGSRPELWRAQGGSLTYWAQESQARLEQDARANSPEGAIRSNQMDLYFSPGAPSNASRQLTRAVATGDVTVQQEDRRGTSNRAEYTAAEGKFVLSEGKPTLYDSTGDTTSGRQLTFYFADDNIVVDSEEGSRTITLHQVEK